MTAMPVTTLNGREVHVDDEGFLTEYDEWDEDLAKVHIFKALSSSEQVTYDQAFQTLIGN